MLGGDYPEHYWSYPPHVLLFIWPLGLLPYLAAYAVWCIVGVALYLWACSAALPRRDFIFLAAAPAVAVCIFFGQNGFYTAALLIGGLANRERRPILAGILFGILTVKPQLGLLLPLMLVLERRWAVIAAAIITTTVLIVVTALLFGVDIWIEFWRQVVPQQQWLTKHGAGLLFAMVPSVYFGARLMHVPENVAWAGQIIVATLALSAVTWAYWRHRDPDLSLALLLAATFLVTPYILNYDMVVLGFAVALLRGRAAGKFDHRLLLAVWTLPVTMMIAAAAFIPLGPVVLSAFAVRLVRQLVAAGREGQAARTFSGTMRTLSSAALAPDSPAS